MLFGGFGQTECSRFKGAGSASVPPTGYLQSHDERLASPARGIGITFNSLYR